MPAVFVRIFTEDDITEKADFDSQQLGETCTQNLNNKECTNKHVHWDQVW
jgi:hypothetical protein